MTQNAPRGLATVALLKARFDQGRDHLGLFEPFVEDALRHSSSDNFIASDVCAVVASRSGLVVPANSMQALLSRFARAGYLARSGGRFVRTQKAFTGSTIDEAVDALQREQQGLAEQLCTFASAQGLTFGTEDALTALATFAGENKVSLVLDGTAGGAQEQLSVLTHKQARVIARFVSQRCLAEPTLRGALTALVEGLVLRDALLLSDLADLGARFQHLTVAIDTPVLLAALDLMGVANGIAAREFITILQQTGARTVVFEPTRMELRGILAMYEYKLATAEGRLALYRNEVTIHVLSHRMTPSDMRTIAALLDRRLGEIGLPIMATPKHDPRYTLDEGALANALVLPRDPDPERPRIRHDVDCVAAVLTLRQGQSDPRIERCVAVFCSATTQVIRNVQAWYVSQGGVGIPPIVHQVALSSIAWLKRPAVARGIKMHELAATCAAVLRPQRATWDKFVETLKKLRDEGSLSDDESVAIVASELAEPLLAELDEDYEPDADSILEAIERVRRMYQDQANAVAAARVAEAQAEIAVARDVATQSARDASQLREAVEQRAQRMAHAIAVGGESVAIALLIASAVLAVPGAFDLVPRSVGWLARVLLGATGLFYVVSVSRGVTLGTYRKVVHEHAADAVRHYLIGGVETNGSAPT